ncbi:hypothetical protein DRV84_07460 [Rhodosalinus sediminis]|uniref:Uncharacterized protein n=1 Tax=Rhodosalinus sediminis TaxID=1940533 RepID=A0A3D9BVD0_9RHOB|nr:hypothetical protein DRV84_07460 [Rhodosalinus sediminis]
MFRSDSRPDAAAQSRRAPNALARCAGTGEHSRRGSPADAASSTRVRAIFDVVIPLGKDHAGRDAAIASALAQDHLVSPQASMT